MIKNNKLFCDNCEEEIKGLPVKEYDDGVYCSNECRFEFETGYSGEEY